MRLFKLFSFVLILTLAASCTKDDFTTGFDGTVLFGSGDCMPVIDESDRDYQKLDGRIYFIEKSAADSMGQPGFVLLKGKSTSIEIRNGKASVELPAGTFVVMTEDDFVNESANTVTITEGQVSHNELKIWVCTSY